MAAPHVAGAVALLKQAFPNLTGRQILEAIYNTARDLGTVGEDNTYGTGLIDVYAAFLSLGTPDTTAPDPIVNLAVTDPTSNSLTLQWTVPFDSTMNGVTDYDIRYSLNPIIDETTFNNATPLIFQGTPGNYGSTETFVVSGLNFSTSYHFSIKSRDMWGNWSNISNPASGTTWIAPQIVVNPLTVNHLLAPQTTVTDTIKISNITSLPSTLDFTVSLENNTFPDGLIGVKLLPKSEYSEVIENNSDKEILSGNNGVSIDGQGGPDLFGYKWIAMSSMAIALTGFLVWGHHMFTSGMEEYLRVPFMYSTLLVAVPTGIKFFSWVATIWQGRIRFPVPMLFLLGALIVFLMGGLSGPPSGTVATDLHLHDTYFIVGHFHDTMFGGYVFPLFAAIYYWFPKVTGRKLNETLGKIHFYLMTPSFLVMTFGQMQVGLLGMRRRIADYDPAQGFDTSHLIITIAGFLVGLSVLIFFINIAYSVRRGAEAKGNIWESRSPEWTLLPSPAPMHNYSGTLQVVGEPYDYGLPGSKYVELIEEGGEHES
jgi:hypothetical protein